MSVNDDSISTPTPAPAVTAPAAAHETSLDGAVLDAFRSKITARLSFRPARSSAPDSPGATMARLRRLSA